jgi:ArsR family transcriptional regulator
LVIRRYDGSVTGPHVPLDRLAHVLGDPMRLRILDLLAKGRRAEPCCSPRHPERPRAVCACDLRPAFGDIVPSKLAYHLKELREAGLVTETRKGKWVYYTLDQAALERFARRLLRRYVGRPRSSCPAPSATSGAPADRSSA